MGTAGRRRDAAGASYRPEDAGGRWELGVKGRDSLFRQIGGGERRPGSEDGSDPRREGEQSGGPLSPPTHDFMHAIVPSRSVKEPVSLRALGGWEVSWMCFQTLEPPPTSLHLRSPPSTSPHLPPPPLTSLHLPSPPSTSLHLPPPSSTFLHLPPPPSSQGLELERLHPIAFRVAQICSDQIWALRIQPFGL
nr:uncharacterized protein LOC129480739 [Symphalangus syndactylus]